MRKKLVVLMVLSVMTWFMSESKVEAKDYNEYYEKNAQFKVVAVNEDGLQLNNEGEFEIVPEAITYYEEALVYQVQPGDTLSEISYYFEISIQEILEMNPEIEDEDIIYVGQIVRIL